VTARENQDKIRGQAITETQSASVPSATEDTGEAAGDEDDVARVATSDGLGRTRRAATAQRGPGRNPARNASTDIQPSDPGASRRQASPSEPLALSEPCGRCGCGRSRRTTSAWGACFELGSIPSNCCKMTINRCIVRRAPGWGLTDLQSNPVALSQRSVPRKSPNDLRELPADTTSIVAEFRPAANDFSRTFGWDKNVGLDKRSAGPPPAAQRRAVVALPYDRPT
jgi:hypothetical protein